MFRNYFKTAIRNLLKNKLISFINIFGLAIAIGVSIVVFLFIERQLTMDTFHTNRDRVFMVKNVVNREGNIQVWGDSPAPIGDMMLQDFPQIEEVVRFVRRNGMMRYEDEVFNQGITFTDPSFFKVFTFSMKWGNEGALEDESLIILSEEMSEKYFGNVNPLGRQMTFRINNDRTESFTVGGVMEKYPVKASFDFDFLANINRLRGVDPDFDWNDWGSFISSTFFMLKNPSDVGILEEGMDRYVKLQNKAEQDWPAESYTFEPLSTLSFNSHEIRGDISGGSDPIGRLVLGVIAGFMIALACLNYVNIAIVSAARRLKEIGLRKVMGGLRKHLIWQFLLENIILTFFALVLGIGLGAFLFLRWFENLFSVGLQFDVSNPLLWVFFVGITLVTGLASGAYPALFISSFKPVSIFRGTQKFGTRNKLSKVFIAFQFVLAIITIIGGIMFVQNVDYLRNRDWGYNKESVVVVDASDGERFERIKNKIVQNAGVTQWASSANHVGRNSPMAVIEVEGTKYETRHFDVGENYFDMYEFDLLEGRLLDVQSETDQMENVIINRTLMDNMEWKEPLGQTFWFDSTRYSVVGVVEDFHFQSFYNEISPSFFRVAEDKDYRYLSVKAQAGGVNEMSEYLEKTWKEEFPDIPYNGFVQEDVFHFYFTEIDGHGKIMGFVATLSIILSCIGLFGLVSLNITRRLKEFSIRKVLGASLGHMASVINKQYVWLLLIAIGIGGPLGFFLIKSLMNEVYEYHMPIHGLPVLYAALILISTALLTTSSQIRRVLTNNPVDALRNE